MQSPRMLHIAMLLLLLQQIACLGLTSGKNSP
jgi:hypothetical protein